MKKLITIILMLSIIAIAGYMVCINQDKGNILGGSVVLTGPAQKVIRLSVTSSDEILEAGAMKSYGKICFAATTTYANAGGAVALMIATSTESAFRIPFGPYASSTATSTDGWIRDLRGGEPVYEILDYENKCTEFIEGRNLTNRAIHAMATSSDEESKPFFYLMITSQ